jgi:hypothetical protein
MNIKRWLPEFLLLVLLISFFMSNKDVEVAMAVPLPSLAWPPLVSAFHLNVQFWELVTFCVGFGFVLAALSDLFTNFSWIRERNRIVKQEKTRLAEIKTLKGEVETLRAENDRLKNEITEPSSSLAVAGKPIDASLE